MSKRIFSLSIVFSLSILYFVFNFLVDTIDVTNTAAADSNWNNGIIILSEISSILYLFTLIYIIGMCCHDLYKLNKSDIGDLLPDDYKNEGKE